MKNAVKVVSDHQIGEAGRTHMSRELTLTIDGHKFVRVNWPLRTKRIGWDEYEVHDDVIPPEIRRMKMLEAELMLKQS